ncbi:MAG: hypothetical protein AAF572_25700 [Cyanobacteria bacterium P01_B01_bin.77]
MYAVESSEKIQRWHQAYEQDTSVAIKQLKHSLPSKLGGLTAATEKITVEECLETF